LHKQANASKENASKVKARQANKQAHKQSKQASKQANNA
jgi:hypothetical protein